MFDFFRLRWEVVASDPLSFILFSLVLIPSTALVTRWILGGALEACRERLLAAHDDVARMKDQRDELVSRLESHGEKIEDIKQAMANAPKIHVSTEPPKQNEGKDGDIWFQVQK